MDLRISLVLLFLMLISGAYAQTPYLIAHRGGVVDSSRTENGLPALQEALKQGYKMVEIDMRVTRDGVLIANHDATFKRYYDVDEQVINTPWAQAKKLVSKLDGARPLQLEEIFQYCQKNSLAVMLDNKIEGLDIPLFTSLVNLLNKYQLRETAIMIGTSASTDFFTGKVRLSCTRKQLEENQKKVGYRPEHYFLFERPARLSKEDVEWAASNRIHLVAAINKFHYRTSPNPMAQAGDDCKRMQEIGVTRFQIDSEYGGFFQVDK
jgi:glycerophosphoryl diester phosphodiesterase